MQPVHDRHDCAHPTSVAAAVEGEVEPIAGRLTPGFAAAPPRTSRGHSPRCPDQTAVDSDADPWRVSVGSATRAPHSARSAQLRCLKFWCGAIVKLGKIRLHRRA